MDNPKKIRLSLDISPDLNATLERLAQESHTSKSEVLRKAIALIDVAIDAKEQNQKLGVFENKDAQPHLIKEIVGL